MQAVTANNRESFEHAIHKVKGRCSRVAHFVKTEMRENPAPYSADKRERISGKVHEMESKCMKSLYECCLKSSSCLLCIAMMVFHDSVFKVGGKLNDIHGEEERLRELRDSTEKVCMGFHKICMLNLADSLHQRF